ncbi:MAG: hypothetical protein U0800_22045 [Isosphaeraceae bacterium]
MARRPRTTRRRRIAGTFRFHERKGPDPAQEEQRLSLYLPAAILDLASDQAARTGLPVQDYCEALLQKAVEDEDVRRRVEDEEARRGPLVGLQAIAEDAEYLVEWKAAVRPAPARALGDPAPSPPSTPPLVAPERDGPGELEGFAPMHGGLPREAKPMSFDDDPVAEIVLRHAGLGYYEDPAGLLPSLRRGEPIGPASARELLAALEALEKSLREEAVLDRRLAYALHRLAFEGQILLTDGWPARAADAATVDVLHLVQEGVDRVLSGEDIRYYPREGAPGVSP